MECWGSKYAYESSSYNFNDKVKITSSFLLDQNLENFNKNQIDLGITYPKTNFNLTFLEESQHIGNTKYLETKAGFNFNNGLINPNSTQRCVSRIVRSNIVICSPSELRPPTPDMSPTTNGITPYDAFMSLLMG